MKEYFYKSEYKWLYLSKFFYAFANSFINLFGVVMLYKNGMALYRILLIYGLRFGIMGLCSPLFLKVASKHGIASCTILANLLRIAGVYMIQNGAQNNLFLFLVVMSLPGALSNPIDDAISSQYVETKHRGRYNSMNQIFRICGQVIASIFVTWGVITENNVLLLLILSIFFLLAYLCTAIVDYKPEVTNQSIFKETINGLLKQMDSYKVIYMLTANQIIERLFLPLYVYLALQDFIAFSTVVVFSLGIQMITILLAGKFTDRNIQKTNDFVTIIRVFTTAIFLFAKNKITISVNKMFNDNFEKIYQTTTQTSIQNRMRESNVDKTVLATVRQMSLCFAEIIVLSGLSLISYFMGPNVFYVIFVLSIISTLAINLLLRKK